MTNTIAIRRILAAALAVFLGLNGLVMLFASLWWFGAVPGVTSTGMFNSHFVKDVGAAYLVAAAGLGWFAWKPGHGWPAAVAGTAFFVLHALIHIIGATLGLGCGGGMGLPEIIRDFPGVYLPTLLALWVVARKPAPSLGA